MNETQLIQILSSLPLGTIRYYATIGSTNDEALALATKDAPDLSLVVADEQTRGRGRTHSRWYTPHGSALAMSLILRPSSSERAHPFRTTGLLALSLVKSLCRLGLNPQIKWPNDVLISGRKVAGVLVEATWMGEELNALVLGMGVNVLYPSIPPANQLRYPATSVESELGHPVRRIELLREILVQVVGLRPVMGADSFLKEWEESLAFRGRQVRVEGSSERSIVGQLTGLNPDGSLRLRTERSKSVTVQFGEVHLRPLA